MKTPLSTRPMFLLIREYVKVARPDHWIKHIFVLPGIVFAFKLTSGDYSFSIVTFLTGMLSVCFLSSANYAINEWLDADFDRFHPTKKFRPAAAKTVSAQGVFVEYFLLVIVGLFLAWKINSLFFFFSISFLFIALLYNSKPVRLKDRVYVDVLTEALNNPVRLMLGWSMISSDTLAPGSILLAFWFGGSFLMTAKRLAELRYMDHLGKSDELYLYRPGFRQYTEKSLIICIYLYSILASFNIAIFLVKYRSEYILSYPIIALLFAYYFFLTLKDVSVVQNPEKLYREKPLSGIILMLSLVFVVLSFVDFPFVNRLFIEITLLPVSLPF